MKRMRIAGWMGRIWTVLCRKQKERYVARSMTRAPGRKYCERKCASFLMAAMLVISLSGCDYFDKPVTEGRLLFFVVFLFLCQMWDISINIRRRKRLWQRVNYLEDKIKRLEAEIEEIRWQK